MEKTIPTVFADKIIRFFVIIVLFIALLNRLQGLTILALAILFFIYGAKIWSKAGKRKTFLKSRAESKRLFPGEKITISVTVENRKILPIWLRVIFVTSEVDFLSQNRVKEISLLSYQKVNWKLKAAVIKRGWYLISPPSLQIGDPFGLFKESITVDSEPIEYIVYPTIYAVEIPRIPHKMFMGDVTDKYGLVKDPVLLSGTRKYQYGQPARYINWKASARHQSLQEKTFESSMELKVLFIIDVAIYKDDENFERMIEVAASMAVKLDEDGFSFGLITNGNLAGKVEQSAGFLKVTSSKGHLSLFLELMARLQPDYTFSIEKLLEREVMSSGITAIYFSYYNNEKVLLSEEILREKGIQVMNIFCKSDEAINREMDHSYPINKFLPYQYQTEEHQEKGEE